MSNPTDVVVSFQQKVEKAAQVMKITPAELLKHLADLGIEPDADGLALLEASTTQENDARRVMVEGKAPQVKVARFKAGWAILKNSSEKAEQSNETSDLIKALKPTDQYSDRELIEQYNAECSSKIVDELRKRSNSRPFVVFQNDGATNVIATQELLRLARRQETPSTYIDNKGGLVKVCQLGEFPMTYVEECPLHGIILAGNYCEKCGDIWDSIKEEDRVIIKVANNGNNELVNRGAVAIHELIEKVRKEGAQFLLSTPSVRAKYDELKLDDKLPKLRRRMSQSMGVADPFHHRVF